MPEGVPQHRDMSTRPCSPETGAAPCRELEQLPQLYARWCVSGDVRTGVTPAEIGWTWSIEREEGAMQAEG